MSALHRFTFTSVSSTVVLALGLASGLGLPMVGCQQPQPYCTTAHGDFAATYTLKKGGDPNSACGQLKGEVLGFQTYSATGGLNGTPKFSEATMAIRPTLIGELVERGTNGYETPILDPNAEPNALAKFTTSLPDDNDFCEANKFSAAEINLPELPLIPGDPDDPETPDDESTPDTPAQPATSIKYEWSNARVVVSANYQGTQFSADLKFTQDGCTAEYEVVAVYPVAPCATDDECQDTSVTGINPDFDLRCEPDLGFCVLNGDIPALK
jgi:hypothetical protein